MITYGYAKQYQYAGDGTLQIQVRIPSVHGPYEQIQYKGQRVRNYTQDDDLPFYVSVLLPHLPAAGEVVMLCSIDEKCTQFVVVGLTGGSYYSGLTSLGE